MLNSNEKAVKSTSFGSILLIKWFFEFAGVSTEKTSDLLMLVERRAKETRFKLEKSQSNPETQHGDPVPRSTTIPNQNFAKMEPERRHGYPVPCGTIMPPSAYCNLILCRGSFWGAFIWVLEGAI